MLHVCQMSRTRSKATGFLSTKQVLVHNAVQTSVNNGCMSTPQACAMGGVHTASTCRVQQRQTYQLCKSQTYIPIALSGSPQTRMPPPSIYMHTSSAWHPHTCAQVAACTRCKTDANGMQHNADSNTPPAQQQHIGVITQMAKHLMPKATVRHPMLSARAVSAEQQYTWFVVVALSGSPLHTTHTQSQATASCKPCLPCRLCMATT